MRRRTLKDEQSFFAKALKNFSGCVVFDSTSRRDRGGVCVKEAGHDINGKMHLHEYSEFKKRYLMVAKQQQKCTANTLVT
jgi:hypothetical protein